MIWPRHLILTLALLLPATAHTAAPDAPAPSMPSEHRLSDAEIERVLEAAANKREMAERAEVRASRQVRGEVGVSVGTGGYRSAFGTAVVPLPTDGVAILSFETTDFGDQRPVIGQPPR